MARIGFIGLGNMGAPMAASLVKAQYQVTGFDLVAKSVSALAEISNYVMLEVGRPSHVFDLHKIHGGLDVRWGRKSESLKLLNGNTIEVDEWVGVIADEKQLESLAGMIDEKIGQMRTSFGEIGDQRLVIMAALTIADNLTEAREETAAERKRFEEAEQRTQKIAARLDELGSRLEQVAARLGGDAEA